MFGPRRVLRLGIVLAALLIALLPTRALASSPGQLHEHAEVREPMVFDLVRGLGAKRGEFEVNTLLRYSTAEQRLQWAPEVEWVLADGIALELELPMVGTHLEAIKLAGQITLPRRHGRGFIDGIQGIVELPLADHPEHFTGLYLAGWQIDRLSLLTMVGPRVESSWVGPLPIAGVINFAAFLDVSPRAVVGLEIDSVIGATPELTVMPQLHLQLQERLRMQAGAGMGWSPEGLSMIVGMRLIFE